MTGRFLKCIQSLAVYDWHSWKCHNCNRLFFLSLKNIDSLREGLSVGLACRKMTFLQLLAGQRQNAEDTESLLRKLLQKQKHVKSLCTFRSCNAASALDKDLVNFPTSHFCKFFNCGWQLCRLLHTVCVMLSDDHRIHLSHCKTYATKLHTSW